MTQPVAAGAVTLHPVPPDHPVPPSDSPYADWGDRAPEAAAMELERWLIELTGADGAVHVVGDLSAHAVWYGPTAGSRAINIGVSVVAGHRRQGIGTIAQQRLAEELHRRGIVRVEASTDVENIPEQRALARAGFLLEGTLRKAQARADGLHDLQVWAHLE